MISRLRLFRVLLVACSVANGADLTSTNPAPPAATTNTTSTAQADPVAPEFHARSIRGQRAPKFEIEKWLTAVPSLPGKCVLIDFWATWCVPCRQSIPELNHFHTRFKDRLVIIGITDETADEVHKTTLPPIEYAMASDPDQRMMRALQIEALPHSILIDPSGIVRYEGSPLFLDDSKLQHLLEKYSK